MVGRVVALAIRGSPDADRRAWLAWARAPQGTFTRTATDRRFWPMALAITLFGSATLLATAWARLRPPSR